MPAVARSTQEAWAVSLALTGALSALALCLGFGVRAYLRPWAFRSSDLFLHDSALSGARDSNELVLQPVWDYATKTGPLWIVQFLNAAVFPGILSLVYYLLACLPCVAFDAFGWLGQFKIQPAAKQPLKHPWRDTILCALRNNACVVLPGVIIQAISRGPWLHGPYCHRAEPGSAVAMQCAPLNRWNHSTPWMSQTFPVSCLRACSGRTLYPSEAPTLVELSIDVLACLVVFDMLYHYWHRTHHLSRGLYRHVHRVHHEYHAPFVFVTQHMHPMELIAVSVFSILTPIALGVHPLTEWIWLLLSVQLSVDAHAGYDFGILDKIPVLGKVWGGAQHHDRHHQTPTTNFQPFFTWFDALHGTSFDPAAFSTREKKRR